MKFGSEILKYVVLLVAVAALMVAFYFKVNDETLFLRFIWTLLLVDLPLLAVLGLFCIRFKNKKADDSYEVNVLRLQMISLFEWIRHNDLSVPFHIWPFVADRE